MSVIVTHFLQTTHVRSRSPREKKNSYIESVGKTFYLDKSTFHKSKQNELPPDYNTAYKESSKSTLFLFEIVINFFKICWTVKSSRQEICFFSVQCYMYPFLFKCFHACFFNLGTFLCIKIEGYT